MVDRIVIEQRGMYPNDWSHTLPKGVGDGGKSSQDQDITVDDHKGSVLMSLVSSMSFAGNIWL